MLYSRNARQWTPFVVDETIVPLAKIGDKVWIKAGDGGNTSLAKNSFAYHTFSLSGQVAASGNAMSLIDGENEDS